jgi:kynurenine formamidase
MTSSEAMDLIAALERARTFDLEQPRRAGMPVIESHRPGTVYTLHRRHEPIADRRTSASGMFYSADHAGTHIDALCHQAEGMRLHGGVEVTPEVQTSTGFRALGADSIAPIARRGVLIDLPAARGEPLRPGEAVEADELRGAAEAQGTDVPPGCVALVRTGLGAHWDDPERYLAGPGIARSGSEWFVERGVHAVGIDNMAWDVPGPVDPELEVALPGHLLLLVRAGIYIVENMNLEELAAAGVREFAFVCLALKLEGATGSPVRPIALV